MSIRERLSGNEAIAYAMRQINPDVFAAFPITPSTEIPQYFAQYVANGQVDTEYVTVESEHSSMSTCIGAAAAGVYYYLEKTSRESAEEGEENGGAFDPRVTVPTGYNESNEDFEIYDIPSRDGYKFDGWSGTGIDTHTGIINIPTGSTGNRTYTAKWTAINYSIHYILNKGTNAEGNINILDYGYYSYNVESETFTIAPATREGFTFLGWTGWNITTPQTTVTIPKGTWGDMTFTAHWLKNGATVWSEGAGTESDPYIISSTADLDLLATRVNDGEDFYGTYFKLGSDITYTGGSATESNYTAIGNSEMCGKLGQKVAADCVTAIDDGTIPNEWGSLNIDDEGTPTARLVLIENGILKNYMIDKLNARRMNMPITGSGRRQGYMFAPTSRMRNTYIAAGNDDNDEIIATMGDGLYAKKMGGGSVEPTTGKFNFAVDEGYLVKDGKIAHPVRGASLIGRGSEILLKIDRVGRDMQMAQGMCGSISGSVPTNVGQPMIRVSELTVGGR